MAIKKSDLYAWTPAGGVGLTPECDSWQRCAWSVPPAKQGDYAFLLHIVGSLEGAGRTRLV